MVVVRVENAVFAGFHFAAACAVGYTAVSDEFVSPLAVHVHKVEVNRPNLIAGNFTIARKCCPAVGFPGKVFHACERQVADKENAGQWSLGFVFPGFFDGCLQLGSGAFLLEFGARIKSCRVKD